MADIKNDNYIAIQGFMVKELGLTGNELIAYALVYGFSQDGESKFKGSLNYVAEWLNCSKTTAFNLLNKLADDGFIKKTEKLINGVKFCNYSAIKLNDEELEKIKAKKQDRKEKEKLERSLKKLNTHSKNLKSRSKNLNEGIQKVGTNKNNINIKNNINDNIDKDYTSINIDGEVHTSFSEKPTARAFTRNEMLLKEKDMVNRFNNICDNDIDNSAICDCVKDGFKMYMQLYEIYFHKVHPILTDKTLKNVCFVLSTITDTEHGHFDTDAIYETDDKGITVLQRMINDHFIREHRESTNYSITHFANAEYLGKLANRFIEM